MGFPKYVSKGIFTKRHYEDIAKAIKDVSDRYKDLEMDWALGPIEDIVSQLDRLFRDDNINYNSGKFKARVMGEK